MLPNILPKFFDTFLLSMEDYAITPKKKINKNSKIKTPTKCITDSQWNGIDVKSQGLVCISPSLFLFDFIYELNLENNLIKEIPKEIEKMKRLEILNLSGNEIHSLPVELSKLVNLKDLNLSNNFISVIPAELGSLYNIEKLNLDNNPLQEPYLSIYNNYGGETLIEYCKENNTNYLLPMERQWITFDENILDVENNYTQNENTVFNLGTFNILSEMYATEQMFGYVPSWALKWETRKEMIVDEIIKYNLDIICLQEVVTQSFVSFYRDYLNSRLGYDSLFYPKSKASTMTSNFNSVDGCATFWKKQKYSLIEHKCVEFTKLILSDRKYNENEDIINRNVNKDNIALITVLKSKEYMLIVANVHLTWDPEFKDVKLMQCIILIEEITKMKLKYPLAGFVIAGDFNVLYESGVYDLLTKGKIDSYNPDFGLYNYYPYTTNGYSHSLNLRNSYKNMKRKPFDDKESLFYEIEDEYEILDFTNYTATFQGVIDYIFHNEKISCVGVLSGMDKSYCNKVVGFPTIHHGSDHVLIAGRFCFKLDKNKKHKK